MNDAWIGWQKEKKFVLPLVTLQKHAIALGSSGSGKTVFTKILVEEALTQNIPSVIFDVQGDLCSLALWGSKKDREEHQLLDEQFSKLKKTADVTIYTPVSSKGVSICINPLSLPKNNLPEEEAITLIHDTATALTKLLGHTLRTNSGKYTQAVLYCALQYSYQNNIALETFEGLIDLLRSPPEELQVELADFLKEEKSLQLLLKQIKYLTIGQKKLLFQFGKSVDFTDFFQPGKISIMYLNTLGSQEEKEYFVASVANKLYQWMLEHPQDALQGLFVLDEIAPFLPAGSEKPLCKPILKLLFKQARKYGIGCVIATQNPGDIDYKAFSQFGTWAIGRLNLKQDIKKIKQALKSLDEQIDLETTLPKFKTGEFLLYAPDAYDQLQQFSTRWLYTQHKTLTEKDIHSLMKGKYITQPVLSKASNPRALLPETTEEKKQESPSEPVPLQKGKGLLVTELGEETIRKIALRMRKKQFGWFGKTTQQLLDLQREYTSCYGVTVREQKTILGLFTKRKEYFLLFDALTGDLITITHTRVTNTDIGVLVQLNDTELRIARELHVTREQYVGEQELLEKTDLAKQTITKTLHSLEKQNIAGYEVLGKHKRWTGSLLYKNNHLKTLTSNVDTQETKITLPKRVLDVQAIRNFIRFWFDNAIITQLQPVQLPEYKVTFSQEKKTVTKTICGVTGKVIA